ncbi:GAF domain-containing sensor histidine kinase [Caballeronia insecticola]|uniref:histidine kinase n=1 Tax=Caballeronia insecticola TaxID=758793 RepID=R4WP45_9BURK|nr:GAF domain-containing sensor histidine kinase [Caballeronia insecticola]BAN26428.1 sensor histidine kinase [Caballeronia insecticola]
MILRDVGAVAQISAVPSMLDMICSESGMGFAAVARVSDLSWTACAVKDNVNFGLLPGGQLELHSTLCHESRCARAPIVVDDFSIDATYRNHHTPSIYKLRSYISVPIVLSNGEYFGNLCAIDGRPMKVSEPRIVRMFEVFAKLIAMQLDGEKRQSTTENLLMTERETAKLREEFIAVLGHDLRSPLAAIGASADYLHARPATPEVLTVSKLLKSSVTRMSRLIDDIMDFARGRLGNGIPAHIECVENLSAYLQAVVQEIAQANEGRSIQFTMKIDRDVRCDPARLQQLLANLIVNAVTHGSSEEPISVSVVTDDLDLVIQVANQGDVIPQEALSKVFEPYWRPASKATNQGLGLGLYICQQVVKAHGGTIHAYSSNDDGTRFIARIPLTTKPSGQQR